MVQTGFSCEDGHAPPTRRAYCVSWSCFRLRANRNIAGRSRKSVSCRRTLS